MTSAGMHIHVDASAFDGKTLANLAKMVHKQEELILTALGVSQARLRQYTKPMNSEFITRIERSRPKTKEQMNRIWYGYHNEHPEHYDQTRYHGSISTTSGIAAPSSFDGSRRRCTPGK